MGSHEGGIPLKQVTGTGMGRKLTIRDMVLFIFMPVLLAAVLLCGGISYFLIRRQIQDNTFSNALDIVTQLQMNLDYRLGDVESALTGLAHSGQVLALLQQGEDFSQDEALQRLLEDIYLSRATVLDSIAVVARTGEETRCYTAGTQASPTDLPWEQLQIGPYQLSQVQPDTPYWVNLCTDSFLQREQPEQTVSLFTTGRQDEVQLVIVFQLREDFFRTLLSQARITEHGYLSLLSGDGEMLFKPLTPENTLTETDLSTILDSESHHLRTKSVDGSRLLVINEPLLSNEWQILAVFPENEAMGTAQYVLYVYLGMLVLLAAVIVIFANFFARVFSYPIQEWIDKVNSAEKGCFDVTFHDNLCEEISTLNDGLKALFGKMEEMVDQIKKEDETKHELEMAILQAQINPHFLYNTLYSIQQLYGMGENQLASQMVGNLSSFFRLSLSKGREIITIRDEVEHLRSYIAIQQVRYDQLTYEFYIDDNILDNSIVKLTLQPLVENAIYHGLFGIRRGQIRIRGHWEKGDIVFQILDNGNGMPAEQVEELNRAVETGDWSNLPSVYGIKNVQQRIQLYCGKNYGLHFESEPEKGTQVIVKISARLKSSNIDTLPV